MSNSPAKHKSNHQHQPHREHHQSLTLASNSGGVATSKTLTNLSYIKNQDNPRLLPKYTAALSRSSDDTLPMDELDGVQMELEKLLSSVVLRYRALKIKYDFLEDRKHQKKNANKDKEGSPSTSKRKRDEKKSKDSSRHSHTKHSKVKSNSSNSPVHLQHAEQNIDAVPYANTGAGVSQTNPKLLLPKNDIPNKFWFSVEPYCMPITQEDIKFLDDLLAEYTEPLIPTIPELGSHFAVRWACDDLRDEQEKSKRLSNSSSNLMDDAAKKVNNKMIDQGICGPLTQRLISALFEENSNMQSDMDVQDSNDSCAENNPSSANRASTVTSMLKSGIDVEKRLKKELLDLGILEPSDFSKEKEDEVLNEIKRVRTELQSIAEFNRSELKQLRSAAKDEINRMEVKRKLDRIDQEIIEAYKRVFAAKQKKRPLTKHERNEIYRLVDEQKRLSDQLEAMSVPGFNFNVSSTKTSAPTKTGSASKA